MTLHSRSWLCALGARALALAPLPAPPTAYAAQMLVTTTADELAQNGRCSLREAIRNANANARPHPDCPAGSGADAILLRSGTYRLAIGGNNEDDALSGDLDITGDLTISGQGTAVVDANRLDRVFHIRSGKTTINQLTIRGGGEVDRGGGIYAAHSTLELANVTVRENRASRSGGGIRVEGGTLKVTGGSLTGNRAVAGGGITLAEVGQATFANVGVTDNRATGDGGGIALLGGQATFANVGITNNRANADNAEGGRGGGIFKTAGTVTATNTTVAGNSPDNCEPDNIIPGCT